MLKINLSNPKMVIEDIQIKHDRICQNVFDTVKKTTRYKERVVGGVIFVLSVQGRASN